MVAKSDDAVVRFVLDLVTVAKATSSDALRRIAKDAYIYTVIDFGDRIAPIKITKTRVIRDLDCAVAAGFDEPEGFRSAILKDDVAVYEIASDHDTRTVDVKIVSKSSEGEDERIVFGVVLEPETVDSQGDIYSEDVIRKTAYQFMEKYQQFGLQHTEMIDDVRVLESYIAPVDFSVEGKSIKKGTWLMRSRIIDDSIWKAVKDGQITGYSIGGVALKVPADTGGQ